jgi:hypothetical protein
LTATAWVPWNMCLALNYLSPGQGTSPHRENKMRALTTNGSTSNPLGFTMEARAGLPNWMQSDPWTHIQRGCPTWWDSGTQESHLAAL